MDLRHHRGPLAHGRSDSLGRAGANVTDRKHTRPAGFERERRAPLPAAAFRARQHEPLVVEGNAAIEPIGIRLGADEQE